MQQPSRSLLMDSDDSCSEADENERLAEHEAFVKQREDNIARRKQRELLLDISTASRAVHALQADCKKSRKRASKSEPLREPRRSQRNQQHSVSYREQGFKRSRPQLLVMAEAASPVASESPSAEPPPSQADLFEKYLKKATATAHFNQEGHGSKMAVVVNHLVEQLYARSWHVLID